MSSRKERKQKFKTRRLEYMRKWLQLIHQHLKDNRGASLMDGLQKCAVKAAYQEQREPQRKTEITAAWKVFIAVSSIVASSSCVDINKSYESQIEQGETFFRVYAKLLDVALGQIQGDLPSQITELVFS